MNKKRSKDYDLIVTYIPAFCGNKRYFFYLLVSPLPWSFIWLASKNYADYGYDYEYDFLVICGTRVVHLLSMVLTTPIW